MRADPGSTPPPDRVLTPDDERYPTALLLLEKPPATLHARGDLSVLDRPAVAIVGSRTPTNYGIRVAYEAACAAARAGVVVVSGMARGLDARAHRGALDAGGTTIGVLGSGLDVPYPRENADLLAAIPARGLLLSELPHGRPPEKWTFPARNRIVAALSKCVLVVEGRRAGGTDNTAWWMLRLGRRVLAVPGRIDEAVAEGPNRLIQDGATPYLSPQDLLREFGLSWDGAPTVSDSPGNPAALRRSDGTLGARLGPAGSPDSSEVTRGRRATARRSDLPSHGGGGADPAPLDPEVLAALSGLAAAEAAVFDVVTPDGEHIDRLAQRCGLAPAPLLAALSSLELKGLVTQLPGKRFRLAS